MSTTDDDRAENAGITRTLQIIVGVMLTGLIAFLSVVIALRTTQQGAPPPRGQGEVRAASPVLTFCAFAFAAFALPASVIVPRIVAGNQRRSIAHGTSSLESGPDGDARKLALVYQQTLIIGVAMNEGVAFLALIAFLIEGQQPALMLALVLILGVGLRFPTRDRVDQWIGAQLERLVQERQLGA
jgi:hypothetical protein